MWDLPGLGMEPGSPVLASRFFTPGLESGLYPPVYSSEVIHLTLF